MGTGRVNPSCDHRRQVGEVLGVTGCASTATDKGGSQVCEECGVAAPAARNAVPGRNTGHRATLHGAVVFSGRRMAVPELWHEPGMGKGQALGSTCWDWQHHSMVPREVGAQCCGIDPGCSLSSGH